MTDGERERQTRGMRKIRRWGKRGGKEKGGREDVERKAENGGQRRQDGERERSTIIPHPPSIPDFPPPSPINQSLLVYKVIPEFQKK